MWLPLVLGVCLWLGADSQMEVLHGWQTVDFAFPSQASRQAMIRTGRFIPENVALVDVDVWGGFGNSRKVFVTSPRFKLGIPATLSTVSLSNMLTPYPDWSWHREGNCDGITSVFRVQVDQCGRLWVLDSGTVEIFSSEPKRICPPQILVFDLQNDKLIGKYRFPNSVIDSDSLLITIAVDSRDYKCQETFAYVADVVAYKLIVFDAVQHKSWRVSSNYFYPFPLHGTFHINNVHFDLMDGVIGLALGPVINGDRRLYFHSLASVRESWVMTSIIRNETIFKDGNSAPDAFHVSQYTRPSQSAAEAMTSSGVLFFGLLGNNSVACWNSRYPYTKENIVTIAQNYDTLQFASGLKIHEDTVWLLTSRLQNYIVGKVPTNQVNYRVLTGDTKRLMKGGQCEPFGYNKAQPYPNANFQYLLKL